MLQLLRATIFSVIIVSSLKFTPFMQNKTLKHPLNSCRTTFFAGTAIARCLGFCATNRKVAGSIPEELEIFIDIKSFRSHYGPGVDTASTREWVTVAFLEVKAVGA